MVFEILAGLVLDLSSLVCGFPSERSLIVVFAFVNPGDDGSGRRSSCDSGVDDRCARSGDKRFGPCTTVSCSSAIHREGVICPHDIGVSSTVVHRSVHRCEYSSHGCLTRALRVAVKGSPRRDR